MVSKYDFFVIYFVGYCKWFNGKTFQGTDIVLIYYYYYLLGQNDYRRYRPSDNNRRGHVYDECTDFCFRRIPFTCHAKETERQTEHVEVDEYFFLNLISNH